MEGRAEDTSDASLVEPTRAVLTVDRIFGKRGGRRQHCAETLEPGAVLAPAPTPTRADASALFGPDDDESTVDSGVTVHVRKRAAERDDAGESASDDDTTCSTVSGPSAKVPRTRAGRSEPLPFHACVRLSDLPNCGVVMTARNARAPPRRL